MVVFTAGMTRSGSTLLERMLAAVPGTIACGEINLLWQKVMQGDLCGCGAPLAECPFWSGVLERTLGADWRGKVAEVRALHRSVARLRHGPKLLFPALDRAFSRRLAEYRALLRRLYGAIAEASGCRIVLDSSKSPAYGLVLAGTGGRLFLIHLVRDPRAVAHSWTRHRPLPEAGGRPLAKRPAHVSALDWSLRNALVPAMARRVARGMARGMARGLSVDAKAAARGATSTHLTATGATATPPPATGAPATHPPATVLRYEDLVANPVAELARLLAAMGADPALAAEIVTGSQVTVRADHTVAGNPLRFRRGPLRIVPDDEWRRAMRRRDRLVVTLLTLPGMIRHRYLWPEPRPREARGRHRAG